MPEINKNEILTILIQAYEFLEEKLINNLKRIEEIDKELEK